MRLSIAHWRRSVACPEVFLIGVVLLGCSVPPAAALQASRPDAGAPTLDTNLPKPVLDTFERVNLRNVYDAGQQAKKTAEGDATCLLPPLTLISSPTVAVEQLQAAASARSEYQRGCAALRKKKSADAEKHFRKALREYPKYATAWVTLGQMLAAQKRTDEARNACVQASVVNPSYVPGYLCLADIAARARAWDEVRKLSARALELDSSANAIAYEYQAAANLKLHDLAAAEKSGLRAVDIDRDHREPRVHFVLAQIYEAQGDAANEAAQLREYLKYSDSATDAAMVEQFLTKLEKQTAAVGAVDLPAGGQSPMREWAPPDIDAAVPPVLSDNSCPLQQILKEASNRTLDLIDSIQHLSASEHIEHIDIDKSGKRRHASTQTVNYVAEIEQNSSGYPSVQEYRSGNTGIRQASVMDSGTAAFALIFHPTHVGNFDLRCEGLTDLKGSLAWQVHFEESADPNRSFTAVRWQGSIYLPRFKGRAWITTDSYNVMRIETDLVAPIAQIDLQREHQVIGYAPVDFPKRHVRLWLPESSSLFVVYRGHRYQRVHTFSQFQLFSVESTEAIKEPISDKAPQFFSGHRLW
jgi:tetratricopeptide (TPR) repeat protein